MKCARCGRCLTMYDHTECYRKDFEDAIVRYLRAREDSAWRIFMEVLNG